MKKATPVASAAAFLALPFTAHAGSPDPLCADNGAAAAKQYAIVNYSADRNSSDNGVATTGLEVRVGAGKAVECRVTRADAMAWGKTFSAAAKTETGTNEQYLNASMSQALKAYDGLRGYSPQSAARQADITSWMQAQRDPKVIAGLQAMPDVVPAGQAANQAPAATIANGFNVVITRGAAPQLAPQTINANYGAITMRYTVDLNGGPGSAKVSIAPGATLADAKRDIVGFAQAEQQFAAGAKPNVSDSVKNPVATDSVLNMLREPSRSNVLNAETQRAQAALARGLTP